MRIGSRKGMTVLLAAVLLTAGLLAVPSFAVYAAPDDGGRVPYHYSFDKLHTGACSDTKISVLRNLELEMGQPIEAAGWVATDEGISAYLYMWVPSGGGVAGEWEQVTTLQILPRPDLAPAGIAYPSGHSTAGFHFTIEPPEELPEGYYDIYIRALDGMGTPCDLAAVLNLRYGKPDEITEAARRISFPRILREGETSLFGGASVTEEAITLPPDGGVRLGTLNLAGMEGVRIQYEVADPSAAGKTPVLGLKSAGIYSYGKGDEGYNTTHSLAFTPIHTDRTEVLLDLTSCDDYGEVWLTGHLNGELRITEVEFIQNGYGTNRVAARIHFSEDLKNQYFTQFSRTDLKGITDPVLGDVLRMEVNEASNDPYVFFNAGGLLKEHDILLDANEYKYMVLLYRSYADNPTDRMNLYLCSGTITGATEECNHGVTLRRDGKWHYLLIDLTQRANWGGIIHGWRFDYLGNSLPGQGVDIASVQFFRTFKAANAAARQDPAKATPFKAGDTPVIRDMREEEGKEDDGALTIDPADTYEITEAPTEPPIELPTGPDTDPADGTTPDPDESAADTVTDPDTEPPRKGCRSALTSPATLLALCLFAPLFHQRKKSTV